MSRWRALAVLAAATVSPMTQTSDASWEKLSPLPEPSGGFIGGTMDGNVVIAGGTNWKDDTKHWLDRIWVFAPGSNVWREAGRLPAPLAYAGWGETKDGLWFAGGSSGAETHTTLSRLDRQFAVKTVATIEPRVVYGASALLDGKLYLIGGAPDQVKVEAMTNACYAIDLTDGKTSRVADLPGPGFIVGAAAACGNRVFVFGGARWDATAGAVTNLSGSFAFSPAENRWQTLTPLPSANRGLTALALDDRHLLIAGGYKNDVDEFTDEAFIFDPARGEFQRTTPLPYRSLVALVRCGDFVYCLGGEDRKKHRTDACFRIRIEELLK